MTGLLRVMASLGTIGLLTAGCSTASEAGNQAPPETPSASQSATTGDDKASTLPHSGAPAVNEPLPISALPPDPCQTFTRAQVKEALGEDAPQGERDDIETGPWCSWQDPDTGATISASFLVTTKQGLSSLYRNAKPIAKAWQEIPSVGGFPAVAFQLAENEVSCSVHIGLANEYSLGVTVAPARETQGDACTFSQRLAEIAVANLREGTRS